MSTNSEYVAFPTLLIRFHINYPRIIPSYSIQRLVGWFSFFLVNLETFNRISPFVAVPQDIGNVFLSLQQPTKENSYLSSNVSLERKEKVAIDDNTYLIFSIHHVRHKRVDYKRCASANTPHNGFFLHRKTTHTTSCVNERFGFVMRNG